jgi:hypothetical protein
MTRKYQCADSNRPPLEVRRIRVQAKLVLLLIGVAIATTLGSIAIGSKSSGTNEAFETRFNALVTGDGLSSADMRMLESMGANSAAYFIPALTKTDSLLQRSYVWTLARLPSTVSDWLPTPEQRAQVIRANAAALVGVLGPKAKFAVPYLADLLQDDAAGANAAVSLGAIGQDAGPAVPALLMAVERGLPFAATALGKIGDPTRATLETISRSGPVWQRKECELALRQLNSQIHQTETNRAQTGNTVNQTVPLP